MMDAQEFRETRRALGLRLADVAGLTGYDVSGPKRWATQRSGVPEAVAILLRLMRWGLISREDIEAAKVGVDPAMEPDKPQRQISARRSARAISAERSQRP